MFAKVVEILNQNFNWIENINISLDSKLRDDLNLDSVSLINFQILIEDEFNIRFNPIEDDITEIFYDINSLINYLEKYKNV